MVSIEKAAEAAFSMLFYLILPAFTACAAFSIFKILEARYFSSPPMRPAVPRDQKLWRKDANFANEIASRCICFLCLI